MLPWKTLLRTEEYFPAIARTAMAELISFLDTDFNATEVTDAKEDIKGSNREGANKLEGHGGSVGKGRRGTKNKGDQRDTKGDSEDEKGTSGEVVMRICHIPQLPEKVDA
jgi:hypothetical protein